MLTIKSIVGERIHVVKYNGEQTIIQFQKEIASALDLNGCIMGNTFLVSLHYNGKLINDSINRFETIKDHIKENSTIIYVLTILSCNPTQKSRLKGNLEEKNKYLSYQIECSVCLDILYVDDEMVTTLECLHKTHLGCLEKLSVKKCPICREPIE